MLQPFLIAPFRAKRGVAAIGSMAEPQQRRNVFLSFLEKKRSWNF
jgi:hypothetical protein